jgi:hypothetical protein
MTATAPATTGMTVLNLAQAGRFEEIHDLFAPPLRAMVPAEALIISLLLLLLLTGMTIAMVLSTSSDIMTTSVPQPGSFRYAVSRSRACSRRDRDSHP